MFRLLVINRNTNILKIYDITKAFTLNFSMKALFFAC